MPISGEQIAKTSKAAQFIHRLIARRHGGLWIALAVALIIAFVTRFFFMLKEAPRLAWDGSLAASFVIGGIYDIAASLWWILPLALLLAMLPRHWFEWRAGRALTHAFLLGIVYLLLYGAVAEWLFWDEFGVRFNFIAVDYLVYTTEVIGNIRESYPLAAILGGVLVGALLIHAALVWSGLLGIWFAHSATAAGKRWRETAVWCAVALGLGLGLNERFIPSFANNYNRELAKNGLWSLFAAFRANRLEFDRFYPTLPDKEAFQRVGRLLHREGAGDLPPDRHDMLRMIQAQGQELRLNVVQITVESLSASFLTRYGNAAALLRHWIRWRRSLSCLTGSMPRAPARTAAWRRSR